MLFKSTLLIESKLSLTLVTLILLVATVGAAIVPISSFEEFCSPGTLNSSIEMSRGINLVVRDSETGLDKSIGLDGTTWHIGFIDEQGYFVGYAKNLKVEYEGYEGWMYGKYSSDLGNPSYDADGIPNSMVIVQDVDSDDIIVYYDNLTGQLWWDPEDVFYTDQDVLLGSSQIRGNINQLPQYGVSNILPYMAIKTYTDIIDLVTLAEYWLQACDVTNSWCEGSDRNKNGSANLVDFSVVSQNWNNIIIPVCQAMKLSASDAGTDHAFGRVDFDGNHAIVGAIGDPHAGTNSGAAYVFDITSGNQIMKLTASDAAAGDLFGISVAIDGDYAIVGARDNDDAGPDSGSAYVFDITTGVQIAKLTASDAAADDRFGGSVAISGNIAIVGAMYNDNPVSSCGSAYLFDVRTGDQVCKLTSSDCAIGDYFGSSVAISGNIAIIGAERDDDNGYNSGSAYVFDITTGSQIFKFTASDGASNDKFGRSVVIDSNHAIVGATANNDLGAAYIFDINTGNQIHKLIATDAAVQDIFGYSLDIHNDIAIVGAFGSDSTGSNSGSAYLFDVNTGTQIAKIIPSDGTDDDSFGISVAVRGTIAIIGATGDDDAGSNSGSIYVFDLGYEPDSTCPTPDPATFDLFPTAISETSIQMTATIGTDDSGVVQYYFTETSGNPGGDDRGWNSSPIYIDDDLIPGTEYTYTVQMRDASGNIGMVSNPASATTISDTEVPTPNPAEFSTIPHAISDTEITMTAALGTDASAIEYYFAETSGNPGATDSDWQISPVYIDSGLDPHTQYTYTVQMRDAAGNVGTASDPESATTMEEGQHPSRLISYYKLDGTSTTIIDEMGVNNGTSNGAIGDAEGKVGTAYSFDGVDDDIALSSPALPTTENADYSITVWIYLNNYDTSNGSCIFSQYLPSANGRYWLTVDNAGKLNVDGTAKSVNQVPLNQWVFIAATRENGTVKGYINGNQDGSGTDTTAILNSHSYIGNFDSSSNDAYCWDGKIDEVKIWNRALSAAEILSLHENP